MTGTHSDWMFEHSLPDQLHPQIDVVPSFAKFDHPVVVDHVDSVASTLQTLALWDHADPSRGAMKPTISIAQSALTVNAGGSVTLPILVTPGNARDATTMTLKGLTGYETITDNLDHQIFTGHTVTLTAAEVNSGLSLASNYTGSDHPVNTLVATALETDGSHTVSSAPQQIVVTDPPVAADSNSTISPGTGDTNPLTLRLSGDMYNGDPQIQVYVDGHQVGGTYDITAHHSLGETQTITIAGNFDPTVAHDVQVQFVNDLWDGSAPNADGHDRNVYVSSISLNGTTIQGENFTSNNASLGEDGLDSSSAVMLVNGTATYNVPADPPLTLQVSGDMYNGAPQIEVFVDGHQVGGAISITAHHSLGQAQTITLPAEIDPTVPHQVQIQFVNDSWDGSVPNTDGHDRNVYVSSVSLDGSTLHGNDFVSNNASMGQDSLDPNAAVMLTNGTATYQIAADPPASGGSTGTSGSSVPQAPSGSTVASNSGSVGTGAGAVPSGTGYYVSPNGSDSNPGTEAAPFATLARAQQAMENSSIKATYVEGGVYHMSNTLVLTGADNGETWQYYPANGVDSAVLDGGNSVGQGIMADNTANITINGLTIRNFTTFGIEASAAINFTVENCDVSGTTAVGVTSGGITIGDNSANVTVANNYVHNTSEGGIEVYAFNPGSTLSDIVIANNVVIDTNKGVSDSGAIYTDMHGGFQASSTVIYIQNNYVKDYGDPGAGFSNSQSHGIYLDDNTNHTYMSGNIIGPPTDGTAPTSTGLFVNSGHDNIFTGNIIDLGSNATAYAASWVTGGTSIYAGMSGNTFTNNIVVENYAGSIQTPDGHVFLTDVEGQAQPYIANNDYYNYGGGAAGSSGSRASDVNPSFVNPQMSGYLYTLNATSPVFGGAVSFPRIVGGWGPTGFIIPQTGATPSSMN